MKTSLPGFLITDRTFASFAPHALKGQKLLAQGVTFFIISISPQFFFFVTSRCHFQDLYILPFRRDLTSSNALLRYALTHVSETVLIIHLYAGFVKLDFPVFTFSCYSTRALYARAL